MPEDKNHPTLVDVYQWLIDLPPSKPSDTKEETPPPSDNNTKNKKDSKKPD